jgi:hypothetical protein
VNTENEKAVRDPMREAFEEWWRDSGGGPVSMKVNARHTWQNAWQAALQSQSNTDEWVRVPTKLPDGWNPLRQVIVSYFEKASNGEVFLFDDFWNELVSAAPKAPQQQQEQSGEAVAELWKMAEWLDNSATLAQSDFDSPPEPQSQFDYELIQAAARLRELCGQLTSPATPTATASQESSSPHGRDADWALAMAQALGTNSGYSVPIVPDADAFRKLFDAVRASQESAPSNQDCEGASLGQEVVRFIDVWKKYMPAPLPEEMQTYRWCETFWKEGRQSITSPTSTAAMVIKQAAECITSTFNEIKFKDNDTQLCVKAALGDALLKLKALTPANAEAELEALMMKVAEEALDAQEEWPSHLTGDEIRAIVQSVIRKG